MRKPVIENLCVDGISYLKCILTREKIEETKI